MKHIYNHCIGCYKHIMEVLEGLFQEVTFMVSYQGEIGINQTRDLGSRHAEQKRMREGPEVGGAWLS